VRRLHIERDLERPAQIAARESAFSSKPKPPKASAKPFKT
jgi:hypothetical protein